MSTTAPGVASAFDGRDARAVGLVLLALVASVTAPLATYALTLATFGAAHVATELRYVDRRYGVRLAGALGTLVAVLLGGVVVTRGLGAVLGAAGAPPRELELGLVVLLALAVAPFAGLGRPRTTVGAVGVAALLALGLATSPVHTLLALACLHNWTPVAFLAEVLDGAPRRRALAAAAVVFGVLPALVATGLPAWGAHALGLWAPDATVLPTGPLAAQLGAYLPSSWHDRPWATHAFSALVFAQCMHYAAVILVLPRLAPEAGGSRWLGRIPARAWGAGVAALAAALLVGHALDFQRARAWYGVLAAVHAWLEVPVLLLALSPTAPPRSPAPP